VRIIDNEMEDRKNEHFEPPKYPILYPVHFEMEYEPSAHFPHYLKEPIEKVRLKRNIFSAAQKPPSENEHFFLNIQKKFVEDSLPGILNKGCFSLPFIDQPIGC
jgi:hypothetical protein